MSAAAKLRSTVKGRPEGDSREIVVHQRSNEIFFAVVGPVGAGGSRVMASLQRACQVAGYDCHPIKASDLIRQWSEATGVSLPPSSPKTLDMVEAYQNAGDAMREKDAAEVARAALERIAEYRAKATFQDYRKGEPVQPDAKKRAYLIESIRHPAEIYLLRRIYANAFALIGVVCEENERERRILGKYFTDPERRRPENKRRVQDFMKRDADDALNKKGQHVTDAFFEADFFIDNTRSDPEDEQQFLDEPLARLVSIIIHDRIIRPTIAETAMHHAHSARVRSACLSRQVGAALLDQGGTVVATGTNEVPQAGGGVYGEGPEGGENDHRCAFRPPALRYCSSNKEQNKIVEELIATISELSVVEDKAGLSERIRKTRLGQLIEFSRAVHAEMDALLSAGRDGVSTVGTKLFVTTFPCHYCARHIISAGVYEVQYIEPYPKSLAVHLHSDAIEQEELNWIPPAPPSERAFGKKNEAVSAAAVAEGKVLFKPFVGVAPRLYTRAFEKVWRLKNKATGDFEMEPPEWGDDWAPFTVGYPELEAKLARGQ